MTIKNKQIKLGYNLFPWQKDIITGILTNPHDIHVVKSKRQTGKSITVETILMFFAINKMNSCSIVVSPTLNQGRKLFKEIKKALCNIPIYSNSNASTLEINFTNGSSILFKSAEQDDALRGNTCSGILCMDEAVFMKDSTIFECFPFVDANKAPILMTSTPKFRTGVFYDFFKKGLEGENGFHSYDVNDYDTSALLSKERLEMYRKSMAPQIFRSEYLGEFVDAVSELFGDVERLCGGAVHQSNNRTMGIDWSNGALDKSGNPDETAIAILNDFKELEKIDAFADKEPLEMIEYIVRQIREYSVKKVVVETNSMGAVYINLLKRKISELGLRCQVVEFYTSNESKREIIEDLQVNCQNGTIKLIKDNKLLLQMVSYVAERTPTGKVTYNASIGHDDEVMALALALHGLKVGNYKYR